MTKILYYWMDRMCKNVEENKRYTFLLGKKRQFCYSKLHDICHLLYITILINRRNTLYNLIFFAVFINNELIYRLVSTYNTRGVHTMWRNRIRIVYTLQCKIGAKVVEIIFMFEKTNGRIFVKTEAKQKEIQLKSLLHKTDK